MEQSYSVLSVFWVLPSHLPLQIRAAVRTVLVARLKNPVMVALCQKGIVANYILVYNYWLLELDDLGVTSIRNNRIQQPLVVLRTWLMLGVCVYRYTYICVCVFICMYVCIWGFLGGSVVKNPPASAGERRCRFDPWVGKIPSGGLGNPLQNFCLENPMDRGAWQATVHRVTKSWLWLKRLSMHTTSFYPFIYWVTLRLLLYLGNRK